jgi:hypothetical protein
MYGILIAYSKSLTLRQVLFDKKIHILIKLLLNRILLQYKRRNMTKKRLEKKLNVTIFHYLLTKISGDMEALFF